MKLAAALALSVALLAAAPTHAALDDSFDYADPTAALLVRLAHGDIPTTTATEAAGQWNAVQYRDGVDVTYVLPPGATFDGVDCSCEVEQQVTGSSYRVVVNGTAARTAFRYHFADATALAFAVTAPSDGGAQVIAYLVGGSQATFGMHGGVAVAEPLAYPGIAGLWIHDARVPAGSSSYFVVEPTVATKAPAPATNWLYVGAAGLAGMVLWAFLVSKGMVQARGRKQVAQVAAHVEVAKKEPKNVLEGKKRALLAALKEVELARQANEMDVAVYDAVKAELKREAVTVMRAIEEADKA